MPRRRSRRVSAVLAALAAVVVTPATAAAQFDSSGTRVVMLGTGTPNAEPDRSGAAIAVVVNGRSYLFDAGPGVVRRAVAATRLGVTALEPPRLDIVFLTHLHSDHTLGLPDLLLSPWTLERTVPLRVFGPPGTSDMLRHIGAAYAEDVRTRLEGGEPANRTGYVGVPQDILPGFVFRDSNVVISAFAVPHGSWKHAYGYRIQTRDRVIVISGDTGPSEVIAEQCAGCDVLLHEVRADARLASRPPEWQRYHRAFHTSTRELGAIAMRARPKLLVLYHQLYWGATDDELLEEVRSVYPGRVISARDLGVY